MDTYGRLGVGTFLIKQPCSQSVDGLVITYNDSALKWAAEPWSGTPGLAIVISRYLCRGFVSDA